MSLTQTELQDLADKLKSYDVIIIPCSSKKQDGMSEGRADQIYCGGYFKKQLELSTKLGGKVYIMSTLYGIIEPSEIIAPYNLLWSKKLQQDNRRMRGKDIPIATENRRLLNSSAAIDKLTGKRVLSFCSLHYRPYMPDFDYFNDIAGAYATDSTRKGIPFLNKTMHQLIGVI